MLTSAFFRGIVLVVAASGLLVSSSCPAFCADERLFGNTRQPKKGFDFLGTGNQRNMQGAPTEFIKTPAKTVSGAPAPQKALSPSAQAQLKAFAAEAEAASKQGHDAYVKGDLAKAIDGDNKSLGIRERYFAETDEKIPVIAQELGEAYAKQNSTGDAIEALNKALKYYSKFKGPGTVDRIPTLTVLATLYKKKNDMPRAFNTYKEIYLIQERAKGKSAPETMLSRMTVARLARELTLNQEAADMYKETVELGESAPGSLQQDVYVEALTEYGDVLTKLNQTAEAQKILARADSARKTPGAAPGTEKPPQ